MPEETQVYQITHTRFTDLYGRFLKEEPLLQENRLYRIGEAHTLPLTDDQDTIREVRFIVKRVAIFENIQYVNLEPVVEEVEITEPHL